MSADGGPGMAFLWLFFGVGATLFFFGVMNLAVMGAEYVYKVVERRVVTAWWSYKKRKVTK